MLHTPSQCCCWRYCCKALIFQPRRHGSSKLDSAILWDFLVSLLHTASLRLLPRRAISFGLVGASGVLVQLITTALLMSLPGLSFQQALPIAVITAASSNYLINNAITYRDRCKKGAALILGKWAAVEAVRIEVRNPNAVPAAACSFVRLERSR